MASPTLTWQASLLDAATEPQVDGSFTSLSRIKLDAKSWVDHAPGWVSGSDELFAALLDRAAWGQRSRHMYDKKVIEPRLIRRIERAGGFIEEQVIGLV